MCSTMVTLAVMLTESKSLAVGAAVVSMLCHALAQSAFSNATMPCQSYSLQLRCIPAYGHQRLIESNCCPGATRGLKHQYQ